MTMIKDVKGFEGLYKINEFGEIYGVKTKRVRTPYPTKTSKYLYIDLWKDGKRYKKSVHRLVAENFIPNPNNASIVDHIDNDILNNHYSNLQWITQKENVHRSYETMSQVRNYRMCELWRKDEKLGEFKSVTECCKYAKENYGISYTSLYKYRKIGDYYIIKV